jgi:putative ABC transport system permease protein
LHLFWNPYSEALRTNIYVFSFIAVLILIIACINFINLTTARSTRRAKEIGMRKVLGASRDHLKIQFLVESLILSFLSVTFALLLVEIFFPAYKNRIGRDISPLQLDSLLHLGGIFLLIIIVGLLAGSYPSFYLASLSPINSIKGVFGTGRLRAKLRNALVMIQFSISIILIISTIFINRQLNYVENLNLGFKKENMVILPLTIDELQVKSRLLKNDLRSLPNVISVTASSDVPSDGFTSNGYIPEGQSFPMMIHVVDVDEQFLDSYQIGIIEGRNFSANRPTDKSSYLINETLANFLNWKEILNKTIKRNGVHPVIGVVKDFNFSTLHDRIGPLIITNQPDRDRFNFLSVNIKGEDISSTLAAMEEIWKKYATRIPFEFHFLDKTLDKLYKSEHRLQEIILYFSLLAIIIASLGLYSLSSIITQQKTKEIGIRKVLGATTPKVTKLITENYLKLVIIANVFAWPIGWYVMHSWLENFAYRVEFSWWVFLLTGLIVVLISLMTVSFQAINAALTNPVDALRYE